MGAPLRHEGGLGVVALEELDPAGARAAACLRCGKTTKMPLGARRTPPAPAPAARRRFRLHLPGAAPGDAPARHQSWHLAVRQSGGPPGFQVHHFGATALGMRNAQPRVCEASLDNVKQACCASSLGWRGAVALQAARVAAQAPVVGMRTLTSAESGRSPRARRSRNPRPPDPLRGRSGSVRIVHPGAAPRRQQHQRRHISAARNTGAVMLGARNLHASRPRRWLSVGHVGQQALAVLQESAALM